MVRMALATVDYEKQCEDSHISGTGRRFIYMYTSYSTYHLPQLQDPQQRSPQQQYSTHPHHETASLWPQPDQNVMCVHRQCDIWKLERN